ncbi:MAG TPA: S41 family peptidase [Dehalococcoidia bacterium]|nr:S41 family peptidase [Dehalococcoidia bacterium]HIN24615.1 S41 family peptidase [Dehalococcoidia bacterium]
MTKSRFSFRFIIVSVLAVVLLAAAACFGGDGGGDENPSIEGLPPEFQRLSDVWELLNREQIDGGDLDPMVISDGAIRGMLAALGDPYAGFLDREQFSLENEDIQGFFGGIGAEVGIRDGVITILAPMPDTPAEAAGVKAGDMILEVDGVSIRGMSLLEVVRLIRGDKGTTVTLLVRHLNNSETVLIEIERDIIKLQSVTLLMQVGRIGHLRLSGFTGTTNDELKEALERFERSQGLGIVLDLRNNPGGLVSSVVDVTSQFIEDGLVLYQIDAKGNRHNWGVKSGGKALDIPMVVLVNEFSASASEVFTGAIIDNDRATVIGTTTFGKGSVTNLWPLRDGSGVNFTTARWFTPNGSLIEGQGLTPDIVLEPLAEDEDEDLYLDRAIEILKEELNANSQAKNR